MQDERMREESARMPQLAPLSEESLEDRGSQRCLILQDKHACWWYESHHFTVECWGICLEWANALILTQGSSLPDSKKPFWAQTKKKGKKDHNIRIRWKFDYQDFNIMERVGHAWSHSEKLNFKLVPSSGNYAVMFRPTSKLRVTRWIIRTGWVNSGGLSVKHAGALAWQRPFRKQSSLSEGLLLLYFVF